MNDQKIENLLNLALDATMREREHSERLNVGYDLADNTWDLIVRYSGDLSGLLEAGIQAVPLIGGYAIVTLKEQEIPLLASLKEIEYIEQPKRLLFSVNQGKAASCITALQSGSYRLFGQGTLVAVIDSGIDYTHPDFINEDGSSRILSLWDQTIPGNPPKGYRIGSEYGKEQIDEALRAGAEGGNPAQLVPSRDTSGHGTQVAGIAAGNGRASGGRYRGVASESELIVVKLGFPRVDSFPRTTELMQAVDYCVKKAMEAKKPVAVNLSFGNVYGSHDGNSLLETYLDAVSSFWKNVIVVGTGNEGSGGGHTSGRLLEGQTLEVELGIGTYEPSLNLQLWKFYTDEFDIYLIHPEGMAAGPFQERLGAQRYILGNTELLVYYGEPSPYSVNQEIYVDFLPESTYIDSGVWKIRLVPRRIVDGNFNIWLPGEAARNQSTRFFAPSPALTITIPSTARKVLSVGAYDSRLMTYAPFSGRGCPDCPGQSRKPDLVAPGVGITTVSPGGVYTQVTGTSFATPFATGGAALLMEWGIVNGNDAYLYGEKVKAYLIRGARPLAVEKEYPNARLGWGTLCVRDSLPV